MTKIERIKDFRHDMMLMAANLAKSAGAKGSHIGGGFSSMEIIATLYGGVMHYDVTNPTWEERDQFIPSKAHCVLSHFAALVKAGFINQSHLLSVYEDGGLLSGRPLNKKIGMEFCGGSLGMGLSFGIGKALYAKRFGKKYTTYVLLGDGECNEGSVWEGFMSASHFHLDNLVAIVDYNNLQFDGFGDQIMNMSPFAEKLRAFGWHVVEVDGHDIEALLAAFEVNHNGKPLAIVAKTIKAHGVPSLENKPESHHAALSEEDYQYIINHCC